MHKVTKRREGNWVPRKPRPPLWGSRRLDEVQKARAEDFFRRYTILGVLAARFPGMLRMARDLAEDDDIEATGSLGVINAAFTFDASRGVDFPTHAIWGIRGEVSHLVRAKACERRKAGIVLRQGSTEEDESIFDDMAGDAPEIVIDESDRILRRLNERERFIVRNHFGLGGLVPLTMEGIGEMLGVSRQRTHQIYKIAIKKLREVS